MPKMTTRQRRRKLEACGKESFGDCCSPKARRAGHPRYPLVDPGGGCEPTPKATHQAWKRARQQHEYGIARHILNVAKRRGFKWAEGK